ncbi:uncharacterized protein [Notamacropus eugenii]|uniref:uncharacterized protein isoform X3 n=1 Tax=Notamacropus eugenii TaxID=9315 RepID=UPI003B685BCA
MLFPSSFPEWRDEFLALPLEAIEIGTGDRHGQPGRRRRWSVGGVGRDRKALMTHAFYARICAESPSSNSVSQPVRKEGLIPQDTSLRDMDQDALGRGRLVPWESGLNLSLLDLSSNSAPWPVSRSVTPGSQPVTQKPTRLVTSRRLVPLVGRRSLQNGESHD